MSAHRWILIPAALCLGTACGNEPPGPLVVGSVQVSSPIGDRLAVGRNVQLVAVAKTSGGQTVPGVTFTWGSSADGIAGVTSAGLVSGLADGGATISAEADGVSGQILLDVIAADLPGVSTATADALAVALVAGLSGGVRAQIEAAIAQCGSGVSQGNFDTIESCLATIRTHGASATDPTDQVLLASLGIFADYIEQLLNP